MQKFKYIILGAGPAGLTFANRLLENGEESFIVLEKESRAGGLCKSENVEGSPLDIGGGHFLDTRNEKALEFIFKFMPREEWQKFDRVSTIKLNDHEIDYPFESNIWQFPIKKQMDYLLSIIEVNQNKNRKKPEKFIEWITWKLGDQIAKDYMIPYNEKVWSIDLNLLGTYWLYKLPDVSLEDTLQSCLERQPSGKLPAHAKFFYPKEFGYEEVWKRMAENLKNKIKYNVSANLLDTENRLINNEYKGEKIIVTIPWKALSINKKAANEIDKNISLLEYSSVRTTYHSEKIDTNSHWTYIPDKTISEHRHLYRFNFIKNAKGYWTETNEKRVKTNDKSNNQSWLNEFAYPLNTLGKPEAIENILEYFSTKNIFGLGRWGEWEHMNSDITVTRSLELADKLINTYK